MCNVTARHRGEKKNAVVCRSQYDLFLGKMLLVHGKACTTKFNIVGTC